MATSSTALVSSMTPPGASASMRADEEAHDAPSEGAGCGLLTLSSLCSARANVTFGLALVAALMALGFGATSSSSSTQFYAVAAVIAVAAVLAWFARSLDKQISRLDAENRELSGHVDRLDGENRELSGHVDRLDGENRELSGHVDRLDGENKELAESVKKLQKLHNDSVQMIRQLAMYGDECKEFNQDLRHISSDLQETDDSLGLTAEEFSKQLSVLKTVTSSLNSVARRSSHA